MAIVRLEGLGQLKKINLIGTRIRDLPAFSIVPQPTTLPRDSLNDKWFEGDPLTNFIHIRSFILVLPFTLWSLRLSLLLGFSNEKLVSFPGFEWFMLLIMRKRLAFIETVWEWTMEGALSCHKLSEEHFMIRDFGEGRRDRGLRYVNLNVP
jgi:hypothetical protein